MQWVSLKWAIIKICAYSIAISIIKKIVRTSVAGIPNAIEVCIGLKRIGYQRAIITSIPYAIPVSISLQLVRHIIAIIFIITDIICVIINRTRLYFKGTNISCRPKYSLETNISLIKGRTGCCSLINGRTSE